MRFENDTQQYRLTFQCNCGDVRLRERTHIAQFRFCCKGHGQVTKLKSCYEVAGFAVASRIESGQVDDIETVAADLLARQ